MKKMKNTKKIALSVMTLLATIMASNAMAAPPMVSEDNDILNPMQNELELTTQFDRVQYSGVNGKDKNMTIGAQLKRGVAPDVEVSVLLPYTRTKPVGASKESGIGDVELAGKWRYYNQNGVQMGVKGIVQLPTGDEKKGLGNGKANVGVLAVQSLTQDNFTLINNVSIRSNKTDPKLKNARSTLLGVSLGANYKVTPQVALVADAGLEQASVKGSSSRRFGVLGARFMPSETVGVGIGFKAEKEGSVKARSAILSATFTF